jgi:molybdopterin synthase catalytic subunit
LRWIIGEVNEMNINKMIESIKTHPDFHNIGMITSHLGIVRSFSRGGKAVIGLDVDFDHGKIKDIVKEIKSRPGIVEILIEMNRGHLKVGDEIMAIVVAGNIRENVFPALIDAVNRVKTEATTKKEY